MDGGISSDLSRHLDSLVFKTFAPLFTVLNGLDYGGTCNKNFYFPFITKGQEGSLKWL
ncbi:hypothetical protein OLMES_4258 [Oleiphilus messinensis]|uniref:Uncharacterized protein n=1 Tax=Oleiphilus messinensis TaxID=141451 RepID=A0A1Y0IFV8_9GAMM|nr:hypothetical protein OLMES_4258 [Oleiphilus messinensis]